MLMAGLRLTDGAYGERVTLFVSGLCCTLEIAKGPTW